MTESKFIYKASLTIKHRVNPDSTIDIGVNQEFTLAKHCYINLVNKINSYRNNEFITDVEISTYTVYEIVEDEKYSGICMAIISVTDSSIESDRQILYEVESDGSTESDDEFGSYILTVKKAMLYAENLMNETKEEGDTVELIDISVYKIIDSE